MYSTKAESKNEKFQYFKTVKLVISRRRKRQLYGTPELSYGTCFYYIGWLCYYI